MTCLSTAQLVDIRVEVALAEAQAARNATQAVAGSSTESYWLAECGRLHTLQDALTAAVQREGHRG